MNKPSIAIVAATPDLQFKAKTLAEHLHLPYLSILDPAFDYLLVVTPDFIGLQKNHAKSLPLYIDFSSKTMQYRQKHCSLRKEALARALGLKNKTPKNIIDATGGLARDSYILAALGFSVTVLERSPIIYTLMTDALARGLHQTANQMILSRIHPIHTDAITYLQSLKPTDRPDIIYLDPMFPPRKKSALPKQDMLIFHDIVGEDTDADALLYAALSCAKERVVVKRPRHALSLSGNSAPSFSLKGSSSRFDIYLI